jgi:predicted phosphoadenosine phosphosulfate sulfurtransferase
MTPYLIPGPACISFSGARTSGYMLRQIVDAYGGTLPDDVIVAFMNTGKREETLRFVHDNVRRTRPKVS